MPRGSSNAKWDSCEAQRATGIDEKLAAYARNDQHAAGMHKARVFKAVLGYDRNDLRELGGQIKDGIGSEPASPGKIDQHGVRFTVDVPVNGPDQVSFARAGFIGPARMFQL